MALDAAHRSSIYNKLLPFLGEEDANALMSEFPSVEAHELVTKDFLRAEIGGLRSELRAEIGALRSELGAEIGALRSELRAEIEPRVTRTELRAAIEPLATRAELREGLAALETKLTVRLGGAIAASTALLASLNVFT